MEALSNTPRNAAITRLLQLGLLKTDLETRSREFIRGDVTIGEVPMDEGVFLYKLTPLGRTVREKLLAMVETSALAEAVSMIVGQPESET